MHRSSGTDCAVSNQAGAEENNGSFFLQEWRTGHLDMRYCPFVISLCARIRSFTPGSEEFVKGLLVRGSK